MVPEQKERETWIWVFLGLGLVSYLAAEMSLGRFIYTDELFFKSAGREWAASGRFASPELAAVLKVEPSFDRIVASYPPLYPFLFGLLVKAVGFGWTTCFLYDSVIHTALALVTALTARRLAPEGLGWVPLVCGLAILPLGQVGRPDELAACFGMAGLLPLIPARIGWRQATASGFLFGLCAATSFPAAGTLGMVAAVRLAMSDGTPAAKVRLGASWALPAVGVLAAAMGLLVAQEPRALNQFLSVARLSVAGQRLIPNLLYSWQYGKPKHLFTMANMVVGLALTLSFRGRPEEKSWLRLWLGPVCGIVIVAVVAPWKHYYYWIVGPWLLVASVIGLVACAPSLGRTRVAALAGILSLGVAAGSIPFARNGLVMLRLPPSQEIAPNAEALRRIVGRNHVVMGASHWWVLAGENRVYGEPLEDPAILDTVQFVVRTGNGSSIPGQPIRLDAGLEGYIARNFEPVHNNLNTRPLTVFGVRLTNSAYGWGTLVLARRRAEPIHGVSTK